MASLITKRFSVLPSLTKYFLQKSSSKSLSSTSFLLQQAKVQHPAPEFKGQAVVDGQFKEVSLSDFKGKWLVLFFYPLDFTFVRNPTSKLLFERGRLCGFRLSVFLQKKFFRPKWIKFANSVNRHLEF